MRSGLTPANRVRRLSPLLALLLAPLAGLVGCDGGQDAPYPTALRYPMREDLLVITPPKNSGVGLFAFAEPPGRLEEAVAKVPTLPDGVVSDPHKLKDSDRKSLRDYLDKTFGTPAKPTVHFEDAQETIDALKLDDATLAAGSKLYRRHCLQCHGLAGDGRGPTGPWVHPHPRDYRQGLFKFISSVGDNARKPRRDDLHRTLTVGIEGTSMPSFALLGDDALNKLISYVIHLSIRGDVEFNVTNQFADKSSSDSVTDAAEERTKIVLKQWQQSSGPPITPKYAPTSLKNSERLESVKRGHELFSAGAGCASCHIDFGRQAQFRYDNWGTLVRPNNLTAGVYRGGRRPIDLYWRVAGGINPCAMPAFLKTTVKNEEEARQNEAQLWDLVNFVQALPYPQMLPDDVKKKVYPEHDAEHKDKVAER